ncbi:hypothetical protein AQJ91_46040 [Streptomyces dysideae]|uniref:Uncharacterized protein n=1 Tax=Streptomyces dysideae TaxID=909626 RepID=A0A124IDA7_9ACTN|nr:hypothetical protein AQJ91_46040 [Streptomyces dysideae]
MSVEVTEFDNRLDVPILEGFGQGWVGLPLRVSKSEVVREDGTEASSTNAAGDARTGGCGLGHLLVVRT